MYQVLPLQDKHPKLTYHNIRKLKWGKWVLKFRHSGTKTTTWLIWNFLLREATTSQNPEKEKKSKKDLNLVHIEITQIFSVPHETWGSGWVNLRIWCLCHIVYYKSALGARSQKTIFGITKIKVSYVNDKEQWYFMKMVE